MSGILSGVTKIFTSVGNVASKVTSSIAGIGASAFTAGVATNAAPMASGGFSSLFGSGTLGNILSGAVKAALPGAMVGAATGQGALTGAITGALTGGLGAGLGGLRDPTGANLGTDSMSTGAIKNGLVANATGLSGAGTAANAGGLMSTSANSAATAQQPGLLQQGIDFLGTERGGQLLAGAASGVSEYLKAKDIAEEADKVRQFKTDEQTRLTNSYKLNPASYQNNTVANATQEFKQPRWNFDKDAGMIVQK